MVILEARSVVGLAEAGIREEEGDEEDPMLDAVDDEKILRITAIHNRFDASYDDGKSGGYRHLSVSVEVATHLTEIKILISLCFLLSVLSLSLCHFLYFSLGFDIMLRRRRAFLLKFAFATGHCRRLKVVAGGTLSSRYGGLEPVGCQ